MNNQINNQSDKRKQIEDIGGVVITCLAGTVMVGENLGALGYIASSLGSLYVISKEIKNYRRN